MKDKVEHLGDGLYVSFDGYQICLMANSPTEPTDTVYLEPAVYVNLQEYIKKVMTKIECEHDFSKSLNCSKCGELEF